jgi:PEP-CTERM motif
MKKSLLFAFLLAVLSMILVAPAYADSGSTLTFDLSGPVSASWTMSQNPTLLFPESGIAFSVSVSDLVVDGSSTPDILSFFNNPGDMGGLNSVLGEIPELVGPQLYSGDETNPTMLTGTFTLFQDNGTPETLTVTQAPEPATLLLLCSGLAVIGLKRKR